jgi:hypothetical protein
LYGNNLHYCTGFKSIVTQELLITLADAFVLAVNWHTFKIEQIVDLNTLISTDLQPGWCKGLEFASGKLYEGFS